MKGVTKTTQIAISLLIAFAFVALIWQLFWKNAMDIKIVEDSTKNERYAINLANVAVASEKLAYQDAYGRIYRGMLDSEKLDKNIGRVDLKEMLLNERDLGFGYPYHLEGLCVEDFKKKISWCAVLKVEQPTTVTQRFDAFLSCLQDFLKRYPYVILPPNIPDKQKIFSDCLKRTYEIEIDPSSVFFSSNKVSSVGLPVDIIYKNGEINPGRLIVWVIKW